LIIWFPYKTFHLADLPYNTHPAPTTGAVRIGYYTIEGGFAREKNAGKYAI